MRFHDHPRLGGMRLESSSAAQVLGSVVHAMVLGAGRQWHVIDADDWRTKAAKAERDAAESVWKVPILRPMFRSARKAWPGLVDRTPRAAARRHGACAR